MAVFIPDERNPSNPNTKWHNPYETDYASAVI